MAIPGFAGVLDDAGRGDGRAHEALYREYAPAVLGYARGRGALEPEDIVGDVFVAVVRGLGRFRGDEAAFRAWLFTIAHHRLVDERRRRSRRREDATDPAVLTAGETLPGSADGVAALDPIASGRLRNAIEGLTHDQREVILLRIVADLPVAAVAKLLGKDEGAVKMLQRRGLATLGRRLSPEAVS